MRFRTASSVACALTLAASAAWAQSTNAALAESLFERGRQLMSEGRFADACPLLAESQRLDAGGGTLLNLAVCHEGEGKLATAWSEFNMATSLAVKDGRKDRETLARARVSAIAPRLSHLVVTVPAASQIQGIAVSVDGTALRAAAWGIATAVDPGPHRIEADAPGRAHWMVTVTIDGDGQTRSVEVPRLTVPDEPLSFAPPPPSPAGYFTSPPAPPPPPTRVGSKSVARYAVGAASLAALGLGIAAGVVALVEHGDAARVCDTSRQFCSTQSGIDAQAAAATWSWVSTAGLGAGVVGAGVFLFWPPVTVQPRVGLAPRPGGGSFVLSGHF